MADLAKSKLGMGAIAAILVVLIGWGAQINGKANDAAADKARMEGRIESLQATSGDHEARIRATESGMGEMKGDIKTILRLLEQDRRKPTGE